MATLSGKGSDEAHTIAVDPAGNIYVAGSTTSPDFPLLHPLQSVPSTSKPGFITITTTGFLVKISPDGTVLYSTYFGGTAGPSTVNAVTADAAGKAYITGGTFASDYPRTPGLPASAAAAGSGGSSAAFFAKIFSGRQGDALRRRAGGQRARLWSG